MSDEVEIKDRQRVPIGQVIDAGRKAYCVEGLIGSGRFGDVYKVALIGDEQQKFAMKTERWDVAPDQKDRRLENERFVYHDINGESEKMVDKSNFPKGKLQGQNSHYVFLVTQLMGPSLYDIRETMMRGYTSPRAIAEIARQTLQAIESLHELGWLHRDIKPHNFAIGLPPKEKTIFLYDFGLARRYRNKEGGLRSARRHPLWVGTIRYATVRGLKHEEHARRDDIESWCYMMLEYYYRKNVLWSSKEVDRTETIAMKEKVMGEAKTMRANRQLRLPSRFIDILSMTSRLSFSSNPDYTGMHAILDQIIKDEEIDMDLPLDWIGRSMPVEEQPIDEEQLRLQLARQKELAARKKKLEERLVELYALSGEPRTLEEVRADMRRKDRKLRKVERALDQSDEDEDSRGGKTYEARTREDSDGDRRGVGKKKKKGKNGKELEKKLSRAEEDKEERRAAKEVAMDVVSTEMIREQLETMSEMKKQKGETGIEFVQMAETLEGIQNQSRSSIGLQTTLDKMWFALEKSIYEEDPKNVAEELREILKSEVNSRPRRKYTQKPNENFNPNEESPGERRHLIKEKKKVKEMDDEKMKKINDAESPGAPPIASNAAEPPKKEAIDNEKQ